MKNREVPESASDIFLVDTQGPDFAIGGRLTGRFHMDIDGPPDAVLGDPKHLGNGGNGKFFSQGQNQGIHQEGKAASRTGPRHLHLRNLAALGALHSWQRRMKEGLELEKVKVLPSPLSPIMNRLITRSANWAPQSFGITSEIKVDLSLFRLETNLIDLPRILKAQRCGEEGRGIHGRNDLNPGPKDPLGYADFHSKRKSAAFSFKRTPLRFFYTNDITIPD